MTYCIWHSIHYFFLCQKGDNGISSRFIPEAIFLTECQSKGKVSENINGQMWCYSLCWEYIRLLSERYPSERLYTVWSQLYDDLENNKTIETGKRSVIVKGLREWRSKMEHMGIFKTVKPSYIIWQWWTCVTIYLS